MSEAPSAKSRKKGRWWLPKVLVGIVLVWLLGDFLYAQVVAFQVKRWEATVARDQNGVLVGCEGYSLRPGPLSQPRDTALLFVHGINASPRHYDKMAGRCAELGYHCRVMRLPGFCLPISRYAQSRREGWVLSIEKEASLLRQEHSRVGIVAHSLGGAAAIGHLARRPDSVDFAVLLAPAVGVSNARSPLLSTRAWHSVGDRLLFFTTVLQSPFGLDCHDPAGHDCPGRTPFTPRVVVDELFKQMDANWATINELKTPLMMVLTKDDVVIDWQQAERFYKEAPIKKKEILFLEDSGHAIPLDYGWEQSVEAIDKFSQDI